MKCFNCNCGPISSGKAFYPIEPKGTKNRKWSCEDCVPESVSTLEDVKELVDVFKK